MTVFLREFAVYCIHTPQNKQKHKYKQMQRKFKHKTQTLRYLKERPMILFLNKYDMFEWMLHKHPLKDTYLNYDGNNEPNDALEFLKSKFHSRVYNKRKTFVYPANFYDRKFEKIVQSMFSDFHTFATMASIEKSF